MTASEIEAQGLSASPRFLFDLHETTRSKDGNSGGGDVTDVTDTFVSRPFSLRPGDVLNSLPWETTLKMPKGPLAIRGFHAEIVDENNASVPLSSVYLHHWLVFPILPNRTDPHGPPTLLPNAGPCRDLPQMFGIGAESRGTPVTLKAPYAVTTSGDEVWLANVHILRTDNVSDVQACIECHCQPDGTTGGVACCTDGTHCVTHYDPFVSESVQPSPPVPPHLRAPRPQNLFGQGPHPKEYRLKYSVTYGRITPETKPVRVVVVDVIQCRIEYDVPPCHQTHTHHDADAAVNALRGLEGGAVGDGDASPDCVDVKEVTMTTGREMEIAYIRGHIHIGSINVTLELPQTRDDFCVTPALYGTQPDAPGDELGYVSRIAPCVYEEGERVIPANTEMRMRVFYKRDRAYAGVMGIMIMLSHVKGDYGTSTYNRRHDVLTYKNDTRPPHTRYTYNNGDETAGLGDVFV
ncbi:unnamed protein product [Vitrella brassicaformis CCMP3155]|uniref:Uncharacterized protein n=1 Tax=Vitrella brassicaformis (strain CCMP3155) TaxID=1169540 RepID=A0A0G4G9X7_VITBC|nr:unnamed protein product [Vitrella brassicaformis CCMP3155]|eukprot:CEM25781.1 unnamed protein product [Vitrella brassicaformis CCMP3155]